jgi:hypothetical protein
MNRKLIGMVTLLAATLPALAVAGSKSHGLVLGFKDMFPISSPFTGMTLRGISGHMDEWAINKMIKGQLNANGKLDIKVRGLGLAGNPPTDPPTEFYATVSCLIPDGVGGLEPDNVSTSGFSADSDGNANIKAKLNLPNPCVAPVVMILNGDPNAGGVWLAVTGFDPVGGK